MSAGGVTDMEKQKYNQRIAGILFLLGTIFGVFSVSSVIDNSDYLSLVAQYRNEVLFAGVAQLLMALSYLGFAIFLFLAIKKYNESLSHVFIVSRILATVFNILGLTIIILLLNLSELYTSNLMDTSYFEVIGSLLKESRDILNHIIMIIMHCVGGLSLYYLLLRNELTWKWLSYAGLGASLLTVALSFLVLFNQIEIISNVYIGLSFPLIIVELILAVILIMKRLTIEDKKTHV